MKKASELFGITVAFVEILHHMEYANEKIQDKLYVDTFDKSKISGFSRSWKKAIFERKEGAGILIGQTYRDEGIYYPPCGGHEYGEDNEPGALAISKRIPFWVVATGVNKTVLVPKDSELTIILS